MGIHPGQPVAAFRVGDARNLIYLIIDWAGKDAVLIDNHGGMDEVFGAIDQHGLNLREAWLTHTHWDHIDGMPEVRGKFADLPWRVHPLELHRLKPGAIRPELLNPLADGQRLHVGSLEIDVLHTPGHTAGAACFHLSRQEMILTGDTLFIDNCGRTDLPTGNDEQLFESLQRLKKLPDSTWVLPGHEYALPTFDQLARQKTTNAPLRAQTLAEFKALP